MDIFVRVLNAGLMIAMPIGLGVYLVKRFGVAWRLFGMGAAVFVGSQVLHIPFNQWALVPLIDRVGLSGEQIGFRLLLVAFLYGLSAGVFEEVARFLTYRFWAKDARSWKSGLMFGAGHGGIEAILLGCLALYALIQVLVLRGVDLESVLPPEQIELAASQIEAYWATPWYLSLMGAVERVGAILFHLSASILVLQAFTCKNILWLFAAILWHTLIDAFAVYSVQTWGILPTEAGVIVFGVVSLIIVWLLRDQAGDEDQVNFPPQPPQTESDPSLISSDNLEDSRYLYLMQVISWQRKSIKRLQG